MLRSRRGGQASQPPAGAGPPGQAGLRWSGGDGACAHQVNTVTTKPGIRGSHGTWTAGYRV